MTRIAVHPASKLTPNDRIAYLRAIASVALVDGGSNTAELAKLKRLGDSIGLAPAIIAAELASVQKNRAAGPVTRESIVAFREQPEVRKSLMMDAIVIAFCDGKLVHSESQQLTALAGALGFSSGDVVQLARLVEDILFKRPFAKDQALARQFSEELGGETSVREWIGHVSGEWEPVEKP